MNSILSNIRGFELFDRYGVFVEACSIGHIIRRNEQKEFIIPLQGLGCPVPNPLAHNGRLARADFKGRQPNFIGAIRSAGAYEEHEPAAADIYVGFIAIRYGLQRIDGWEHAFTQEIADHLSIGKVCDRRDAVPVFRLTIIDVRCSLRLVHDVPVRLEVLAVCKNRADSFLFFIPCSPP